MRLGMGVLGGFVGKPRDCFGFWFFNLVCSCSRLACLQTFKKTGSTSAHTHFQFKKFTNKPNVAQCSSFGLVFLILQVFLLDLKFLFPEAIETHKVFSFKLSNKSGEALTNSFLCHYFSSVIRYEQIVWWRTTVQRDRGNVATSGHLYTAKTNSW